MKLVRGNVKPSSVKRITLEQAHKNRLKREASEISQALVLAQIQERMEKTLQHWREKDSYIASLPPSVRANWFERMFLGWTWK
jgi:hypothetical protein